MFLTGMWCSSLVNKLSGAVNLGVFGLSAFPALGFLSLGVLSTLGMTFSGLPSVGLDGVFGATGRPLRVVLRTESSSVVDLGVGGENGP
jgi:hypothetical protein